MFSVNREDSIPGEAVVRKKHRTVVFFFIGTIVLLPIGSEDEADPFLPLSNPEKLDPRKTLLTILAHTVILWQRGYA